MKHSIQVSGNQAIVFLTDKIYAHEALVLRDNLINILDQGVTEIRMDVSELAYIDSSGFKTLVKTNKRIKEVNGVFILEGVQGLLFEVIKRTKLDKFFTIL